MTPAEMLAAAAMAKSLYEGLKKALVAKGMNPDEFDASVEAECGRLTSFKSEVADAVESRFKAAQLEQG